MRVIDASSLAKYINRESNWGDVEKYLIEGSVTINLAIKEVTNSIWKRVLRKGLEGDEAYRIFKGFIENLMVKVSDQDIVFDDAFKISLKHNITIYDSLYIALAKKMNSQLITSDRIQRDVATKEKIKVIYIP